MMFSDNFNDAMYQYRAARDKFLKAIIEQIEGLADEMFEFHSDLKTLEIKEWNIYINDSHVDNFKHIEEAMLIKKLVNDWSDQFDLDINIENKYLTVKE